MSRSFPDPTAEQVAQAFHQTLAQEAELYRQAIKLLGAQRIAQAKEERYEPTVAPGHRACNARVLAWAAARLFRPAHASVESDTNEGDIIEGEVISIDDDDDAGTGGQRTKGDGRYPRVIVIAARPDDTTDL